MNDQVAPSESKAILAFAETCSGLGGDFVELGCYRGDTSLLLARLIKDKPAKLWLYDSFAGLPEKTREDASPAGEAFRAGELLVSKSAVVLKFKKAGLPLPRIKKAFFHELTPADLPEKIAFAFLDGDLYGSIKDSLALVEERIVEGGVIIVHDYNNPQLPGVAKAVEEWLASPASRQYQFSRRYSLAVFGRSPRRP